MSTPVLILGKSGSGKSASMRNFKPEEIEVINVLGKPLPFRNDFEMLVSDQYKDVFIRLKESKKKSIVIDDAGYLITNFFMRHHAEAGQGNAIFGLYNTLADNFWRLVDSIRKLPKETIVYMMMHEEQNDFGAIKPKTIGKLLDEKVCIEGMFTIVLRSEKDGDKYIFHTKSSGMDVAKTPMGLFETETIDNDLKMVDTAIREYYGMGGTNND